MNQNDIIFSVSLLSTWLATSVTTIQGELIVWDYKKGEIVLNTETRELQLVDCSLDEKLHWAIMGYFISHDIAVNEYTREK